MNQGMIDSSTRRSSAEQGAPRVYDRPRPAVTEFSRRGSKTTVSQEFATHTGAAAKSLGSVLGRGGRAASGRPAAAACTSRRAERPAITLSGEEDVILSCDALWVSEAIGNIIKNALDRR